MARINKIIFVCTDNTCLSNMAAAVFEGIRGEREIQVASRGLVVLFPEPINQKAVAILKSHKLELLEEEAKPLESRDLIPGTLVLTMTGGGKGPGPGAVSGDQGNAVHHKRVRGPGGRPH